MTMVLIDVEDGEVTLAVGDEENGAYQVSMSAAYARKVAAHLLVMADKLEPGN